MKRRQQKRSAKLCMTRPDYVIDTHTAVAAGVYKKYIEEIQRHRDKDGDRFHSQSVQIYQKRDGCAESGDRGQR